MGKAFFISVLFLMATMALHSQAQTSCSFRHYSTEDGLPQFTVTDILQDQKGFIWLSTYDGLSKFDGYEFHNYKTEPGDAFPMKSNRIDRIHEDIFGRIWMESYGGEAHCFNPKTEKFWGLIDSGGLYNRPDAIKEIIVKPSGLVWIVTNYQGCVCVCDTLFTKTIYSTREGNLPHNTISSILEDDEQNTWILTYNGLVFLPSDKAADRKTFFTRASTNPDDYQRFFSVIELDDEIWFGSQNGKIEIYSKKTKHFRTFQLPTGSNIQKLSTISPQVVFIATLHDGFLTYNRIRNEFTQYNSLTIGNFPAGDLEVNHIEPNQIWFSTQDIGIFLLNIATQKLTRFVLPTEEVSTPIMPANPLVVKDRNGKLWVHPKGGGFSVYNEQSNTLEPFFNSPKSTDRRFSNIIHAAYFDKQGNLWMGTRSNGLEKVIFNRNPIQSLHVSEDATLMGADFVRVLFEDDAGNIWISTKGNNQVVVFDKNYRKLGCISQKGELKPSAPWICSAYAIFRDSKHNIWIGTRGDGLFKLIPGQKPLSFRVEHYSYDEKNTYSLSNNNIYSIYEDKQGLIWIATFGGGINLLNPLNPGGIVKFINHRNELFRYPINECGKVRYITGTNNGLIYIGTTSGLLVTTSAFADYDEITFKHYTREANNLNSLSNNDVVEICVTRNGEIFAGTFGGGLNKVVGFDSKGFPAQFKSFTSRNGLPSDQIQAIIEDENNNLWISTQNELARFRPDSEEFEVFTEAKRMLENSSFSEATKLITRSGDLLFGFSNGIIKLRAANIETNRYLPYLAFINFQLFNKRVDIGDNSPLNTAIDDCKQLILSHKQNYFSLEFAALDYESTKAIRYAYMLDGFDEEWNYTQKQRMVSYTNIPKGDYTFRVKSTNSDGVWVENERQLSIVVKPSFWETPLAYVIYFLFFATIIFLIDYNVLTIYRLKSDVKMEKKMSEMKLKFFTDISHEIRTPLTLITAPVEYLINDNRTPDVVRKQLTFIAQNTNRMLRLVNQILDLRKLQDKKLRVSEIAIAPFVQEIFNRFGELADEQGIEYTFRNQAGNATVWADKESLEKMLMNLLSNAFKFIATGKKIVVWVLSSDKQVTLQITDDGPGIAKDRLKNLFVRFASFSDDSSKPSTGIGLALVKELADKHSAKVIVESEVGKGSSFAIQFLTGTDHFKSEVEIETTAATAAREPVSNLSSAVSESQHTDERPKVLIVEDDPELRIFLMSLLENDYRVSQAEDGVQGFEMALQNNPDFIVSDIMMPRMNGIELLKKLRNDLGTSHIPVVMLTAKTDIESQLEGLSYGADDYITKPFSVPYFKTRITNLLQQRKRLHEIFSGNNPTTLKEYNPKPFLITSHDEELMANIMETIEKNIDNGEFTVEEMSEVVGIGRTTLFNKIKSLTGMSPVEFIRDVRLKRAAQLLTDSELFIKEVSYMTGFSDTKYFGKCFKAKYGATPMEFRNKS